jgi:hypothetical protein
VEEFRQHCVRSYTFWKELISSEDLVLLIFRDMIKYSKQEWLSIFLTQGYTLDYLSEEKKINTKQTSSIYTLSLSHSTVDALDIAK